jgi:hypothetical protein
LLIPRGLSKAIEQTTQWSNEKGQKDKQWSTNSTQKTKAWATQTLLKTGDELAMVFSGLRVTTRLLVFCVMLRRSLFVLFRLTIVLSVLWLLITPLVSSKHVILSFCVFCSSPIDGFWLPLWYLQTLLIWQCSQKQHNIFICKVSPV